MQRYKPHCQKLALLMSLTGAATKANKLYGPTSTNYGPEEEGQDGFIDFETFFQRIKSVFMPKSESNLSHLKFESAKQGAQEPPGDYILRKLAMYNATEPDAQLRSFQYLRSNILKGLYSSVVRSRVVDLNPSNDAELINAVSRAAGEAKEKYLLRCEDVTSLDGLASTTQFSSNSNTGGYSSNRGHYLDDVEDMDVDQVKEDKNIVCHHCKKKGHRKKNCFKRKREMEGKNERKGDKNKGTSYKDREKKKKGKCFNCGIMGHYERECRKPKRQEGVRKVAEESEKEDDDLEELVGRIQEDFWRVRPPPPPPPPSPQRPRSNYQNRR